MVAPKLRSFGTGSRDILADVLTPAGEVRTRQGTFPNTRTSRVLFLDEFTEFRRDPIYGC
jgi:hypothetical protein